MINQGIDDWILLQQHKYTIALGGSFVAYEMTTKDVSKTM